MVTIFPGMDFTTFYGFLLPWIFTFAIVYGLLMKTSMFGGAHKQVSVALSFVIAFFVTGVGGPELALFFTSLFGGASVFLAGILVIILFVALLGYEGKAGKAAYGHWAALILVIIIGIILFLGSTGTFVGAIFLDATTATVIFWLIIIIVAAFLITKGGQAPTQKGKEPAGEKG